MKNTKIEKLGRRGFMKMAGATGLGLGLGNDSCAAEKNMDINKVGCLAQDYTVVFHDPNRDTFVQGCGITRMSDGTLVAIVPIVESVGRVGRRGVIPSITHIVRSSDGGRNWQEVSELPYYSAVPWLHKGTLYLFAMSEDNEYRNKDLFLLRSGDGGKTWSEPVILFKGHFWNTQTAMVFRNNRLYWAVCDLPSQLPYGPPQRRPRVIVGDLSKDPMDRGSWRLSEPVDFPELPQELIHPGFGSRSHSIEPNVIGVGGKIRVISSTRPSSLSTAGLSAVYEVNDNEEELNVEFIQYHPMPGGQLKFCIIWDEVSKMFWSTTNLVVDSQNLFGWGAGGNDRRFLMLFYGLDGLNWFQAGCIAQAKDVDESFSYASAVIDGNDLAIISRSNIKGVNRHDADYATFHRVRDFRKLACIDLVPEGEKFNER